MQMTPQAVDKIKAMAEREKLEGYGVRVMIVGGGCSGFSYDIDFENELRDGDQTHEYEGLKVYVDPMSYQYLDGTTIDYVETFSFSGFHFENPNAKRTCGCGSSFSV
jgi:iron-sulfur cluster assembly accessory protein